MLHGGGNTSVKTRARDDLGEEHEVIAVKGSGADMADIEPWGLPAVKLDPLRKLRALDALSDEAMVNVQRLNLLDSAAPNPSVETLLHAFLPHKFVDHTHAAAVLSLVDQPDGEALAREVYDGRMGIVPLHRSGLRARQGGGRVFEEKAEVEGLILHKHGIFTFGKDAREAYERMIEMVSLAESRLRQGRPIVFPARQIAAATAKAAEIAPIIRGAAAIKQDGAEPRRFIADFRTAPEILAYVNGVEVASYSQRGVVTPDHIIRTKNRPLVVAAAGKRQARRVCQGRAPGRDQVRRRVRHLFRAARTPPPATPRRNWTAARASCWCRASACSAWAARLRTPRSPPILPRTQSRSSPTPRPSAATSRCPRAICSRWNIGASSRRS